MHSETLQSGNSNNKQWPDFYSILDSPPDSDGETLRRVINKLYIKASEQSDHRELSTRFYNQVLAQKVLPQCRVILLNASMRQAYDQQWLLHRDGSNTALAYPDFINTISKDADSARALQLSNDEISILPSFGARQTAPPLSPLKPAAGSPAPPPPPTPPAPQPPAPKKNVFPGAALAGLAVLAMGAFAWNLSRQSKTQETVPVTLAKPAPISSAPVKSPLLPLNTLAINADFESGNLPPWKASNVCGFVETPAGGSAKSGGKVLNFWSATSCKGTVTQTIKGLTPGTYTLRARTRRGGGQTRAEMFAQDFGGPRKAIIIPFGWNWIDTTIYEIKVKSNQCTIGFSVQSLAQKTANIDAVEFFRKSA